MVINKIDLHIYLTKRKMITPLIKQINKNSLITFPSSLEDFNVSGFSIDKKKVFHSHFALLNLPDIAIPTTTENKIDFERLESVFIDGVNSGINSVGDRIDLSESLQNFMLNNEALLTEQDWYNKSALSTCSERLFFKWLKEIGAIRYENTNNSFFVGGITDKRTNRYVEETESSTYSSVIQYISKIGVQGKVVGKKNSFNEVYINIPSNVGKTPNVFLKTTVDQNYYQSMVVTKFQDSEYINGYSMTTPTPSNGLSLLAKYNKDVGNVQYSSTKMDGITVIENWNEYYAGLDCYLTDKNFDDPSNDLVTMTSGVKTKTFVRSRLDGVGIDFDISTYRSPEETYIDTLEDYNLLKSTKSFDFNTILLYYTVVDEVTGASAINLYGVAFVGDVVQQSAGVSKIDRKQKIKSDQIIGNVGNGYGFKFNFKLDARQEDTTPIFEIDQTETSTFSMHMFSETMLSMGELLKRYEESQELNNLLINRNETYMDYIRQMDFASMKKEMEELRMLIQENNLSDINSGQVDALFKKMDEVLAGKTDVKVNIVSKFIGDNGISFSYTPEDDTMRMTNNVSDYGDIESKNLSTAIGNVNLVSIKNLKKLCYFKSNSTLTEPINVIVDDTNTWKKGQSLNIVFDKSISGSTKLNIFTDKNKKISSQEFGYKVAETDVSGGNSFNIICVDSDLLTFVIQKTDIL